MIQETEPQKDITVYRCYRCSIEYNKNELVGALVELLTDEKMLIEFRKNAIKMAKKYTWDIIYNNALEETL